MSTIIMIFALPLGIFILLGENRARAKYQVVFDDFYKSIQAENYPNDKKLELFKGMLLNNHYSVKEQENAIIGEKKIFSVGWMFIGVGTLYVGLLVYIVYFLYFQKPHVVRFVV